jgi:hypothetical protein
VEVLAGAVDEEETKLFVPVKDLEIRPVLDVAVL